MLLIRSAGYTCFYANIIIRSNNCWALPAAYSEVDDPESENQSVGGAFGEF